MREVALKSGDPFTTQDGDYHDKGWFQGWFTDFEEFETGPGLHPVGIVELPNGEVQVHYAPSLKFIGQVFEFQLAPPPEKREPTCIEEKVELL